MTMCATSLELLATVLGRAGVTAPRINGFPTAPSITFVGILVRSSGWRGKPPITAENLWRWNFLPRLKSVGLEWATFLVMRRTHASLMRALEVDPKLVADQLGHPLDISLNVYAKCGLERRGEALALCESRLEDLGRTAPAD